MRRQILVTFDADQNARKVVPSFSDHQNTKKSEWCSTRSCTKEMCFSTWDMSTTCFGPIARWGFTRLQHVNGTAALSYHIPKVLGVKAAPLLVPSCPCNFLACPLSISVNFTMKIDPAVRRCSVAATMPAVALLNWICESQPLQSFQDTKDWVTLSKGTTMMVSYGIFTEDKDSPGGWQL